IDVQWAKKREPYGSRGVLKIRSEVQFDTKLQVATFVVRSRRTDGNARAALCAFDGLNCVRAGDIGVASIHIEVVMVKDVEGLTTKLQVDPLRESERLIQTEIEIPEIRSVEVIAAYACLRWCEVALPSRNSRRVADWQI